jgi:alpha-galactosidase
MVSRNVEDWLVSYFGAGILPPFSFGYGDRLSNEFISDWRFSSKKELLDSWRTKHTFIYEDPETRLQVCCECLVFKDYSAIEWVIKLRNNGKDNTAIIKDIQALDTKLGKEGKGEFILHRALGCSMTRKDFAPIDELIHHVLHFSPVGGKSSKTTALPFFNIEAVGEGGVMVAVGWTGQWAATLTRTDPSSLHIRAGMELTHLKLHPGEEIRTPRILLLFWQGDDYILGHNLLRRFLLKHHVPKKDGEPVTLPFACNSGHIHDEATKATEQNQIDFASQFTKFGVEYLWIDAGWYEFEEGWADGVGNWFVDRKRFPNGLRPVSEALKKMGMGIILWFAPEVANKGTYIEKEHPEWLLKMHKNQIRGLLNLGNKDARKWLTEHISKMIRTEGINVYRQDGPTGMDPLQYWRKADEPDRQGINEIRYIEGLYAFWDELLRRNPGLIIDLCSGGGNRIDLETVSRCVFLWRTDYNHPAFGPSERANGFQSHTYGISLYVPTTSIASGYPETYSFRSSINNGLSLLWNPYQPKIPQLWPLALSINLSEPFPFEIARRLVKEFKRVRHFFFGDFYPLTPYSVTDDTWLAYQFHKEDLNQGMALAFRRSKCPNPRLCLELKGLSLAALYEVHFEDTGVKQIFTGKHLADKLDVKIENAPGSMLITYKQIQ